MPQTHVSIVSGTGRAIVHGDFVGRGRLVSTTPHRVEAYEVRMNRAAWLEKHDRQKEADRIYEELENMMN